MAFCPTNGGSMKHTMLDLETMGISAGCAIMSIGAVEFDPESQTLGRTFYRTVDLQSCLDVGLRIDASTLYWWLEQSDEARKALTVTCGLPLSIVLDDFSEWFDPNCTLWSHGLTFDLPVLQAAYEALKTPVPWQFRNARDTRTIFDLAGVRMAKGAGTHHNALDDARNQADAVIEAYQKLR